jgi:hypothetical protein
MLNRNEYSIIIRYEKADSIRNGNARMARKLPISHKVGREIVKRCRAGKWYPLSKIADAVGASEVDTRSVVERMCWPSRTAYRARAERKQVGNECHFRIFKLKKTVSVEELTTKLRPIVEGLKVEGKKNMATMVPAEVAMLAARLEHLLNEWAE